MVSLCLTGLHHRFLRSRFSLPELYEVCLFIQIAKKVRNITYLFKCCSRGVQCHFLWFRGCAGSGQLRDQEIGTRSTKPGQSLLSVLDLVCAAAKIQHFAHTCLRISYIYANKSLNEGFNFWLSDTSDRKIKYPDINWNLKEGIAVEIGKNSVWFCLLELIYVKKFLYVKYNSSILKLTQYFVLILFIEINFILSVILNHLRVPQHSWIF